MTGILSLAILTPRIVPLQVAPYMKMIVPPPRLSMFSWTAPLLGMPDLMRHKLMDTPIQYVSYARMVTKL